MAKGPKGQTPNQQAVRVGRFEDTMQRFSEEMGRKQAQSFASYHNKFIQPLEMRIKALERRSITIQTGRFIMRLWVRFWILITWEISDQQLQEQKKVNALGESVVVRPGWQPRWYQGLARRNNDLDGFTYHLRPFSTMIRFYDAWVRVRAARLERKAQALAKKVLDARADAAHLANRPDGPELVDDDDRTSG